MTMPVIPHQLLPADGRFGCGPSRIRPAQVDALAALGSTVLGTSHRQQPVRHLVAQVRQGLADLLGAPADYQIVLGNGGSSVFWDAAIFSLIDGGAQFAACGEFGNKFAAAATSAPFLGEVEVINAEPGTQALPQVRSGVTSYAWAHNETSTGVLTPVVRPDDSGALVLVDGTSAAGGVAVDLAACDVYYFAPQKALGSDGGLWFAAMSPAALARIEELSHRWIPSSLSLSAAVASSGKDETVNTPALATLVLIAEQVHWLLDKGGLSWAAARTAASSRLLYDWAESREWARPFVGRSLSRSPVVGTIDLADEIDGKALIATLRANGIVDVDPYRKLGRNQLRVGMFPSVPTADVEALTACIDYAVERLG
ncbi:MAG: phosphoserine transaminase [Beutenbergiaceae bacterium]